MRVCVLVAGRPQFISITNVARFSSELAGTIIRPKWNWDGQRRRNKKTNVHKLNINNRQINWNCKWQCRGLGNVTIIILVVFSQKSFSANTLCVSSFVLWVGNLFRAADVCLPQSIRISDFGYRIFIIMFVIR